MSDELTCLDEIVFQAEAMLGRESFCTLNTAFRFVASAAFREGAAECALAVWRGEDVLNFPGRVQPRLVELKR